MISRQNINRNNQQPQQLNEHKKQMSKSKLTRYSYRKLHICIGLILISVLLYLLIYGFLSTYFIDNIGKTIAIEYLLMVFLSMVGFGLLLALLRNLSWTSMVSTIYVIVLNILLGPLIQKFWFNSIHKSFFDNNTTPNSQRNFQFFNYNETQRIQPSIFSIRLTIQTSISFLVSMHAMMGRVNMVLISITLFIFIIGWNLSYYVNAKISTTLSWNNILIIFDEFGCNNVFLFGSMFGMGFSRILSCSWKTVSKSRRYEPSRQSIILVSIGLGVVMSLFPYIGQLNPRRPINLGSMDIYFALTGSVLGSYATSAIIKGKIGIHQCLYGVLGGAVMVGTVGGLIDNISGSLTVGLLGGIASGLWYRYAHLAINNIKINDSNGLSGIFFVTSILGSLVVGPAIIASYVSSKKVASISLGSYKFQNYFDSIMLIAYAIISSGIGFFLGMLCGMLGICFGSNKKVFDDSAFLPISYQSAYDENYLHTDNFSVIEESNIGEIQDNRGFSTIKKVRLSSIRKKQNSSLE